MGDEQPPRATDYRLARIVAASVLIGVLAFLLIYDAITPDYDVDHFVLVTLVVAILTLVGLEARDIFWRT